MGVNHRLLDLDVSEYLLQYEDIVPVHHKVRGKRMEQGVYRLAFRQLWCNLLKKEHHAPGHNQYEERAGRAPGL